MTLTPNVFVVDNHDSFTYNVVELLRQVNASFVVCDETEVDLDAISPFSHILLSAGADLPCAYPNLARILTRFYQQKAFLGICLGHQALWEFFGGELLPLSQPRHGEKRQCTVVTESPLFAHIPSHFPVGLYHSWAVNPATLPPVLQILATDDEGVVQATAHQHLPIYSLQFHPESIMSAFGQQIIYNWLHCLR